MTTQNKTTSASREAGDADEAAFAALLAALRGVARDGIAMIGFHEQFRNEIRAAIAKAGGRAQY